MRRLALFVSLVGLVAGVAASSALSAGPLVTGPHFVNFGMVPVTSPVTSSTVTLTFTNNSSQKLYWNTNLTLNTSLHGDGSQFFVYATNCHTSGAAPNGGTCTATASFKASNAGNVTAELSVVWGANNSPYSTSDLATTTTILSGYGG